MSEETKMIESEGVLNMSKEPVVFGHQGANEKAMRKESKEEMERD